MENIKYCLKEHTSGNDTSYGIEILENGTAVQFIPDVFAEKSHAENLVRMCNENDVDPVHIGDVISDMQNELLHSCV